MERDFLGFSDKQYLNNVEDDRVGERGLCSCLATCTLEGLRETKN